MIACPYCNSQVSVARPLPGNRRLICPRCGEAFPYRGPEPEEVPPLVALTQPRSPTPPSEQRWSNRAIAGMVLAVMGAMAVIALTAALLTEQVRREHDILRMERRPPWSLPLVVLIGSLIYVAFLIYHAVRRLRRTWPGQSPTLRILAGVGLILLGVLAMTDLILIVAKTAALLGWGAPQGASSTEMGQPPPVREVAPVDLEGLGYLPAGTNAVMALHVAQAMQTPAGRAFLDRSQLANSGVGLAQIQESTGLEREQIDHVVLGIRLDDNLLPAPVLVVRTRQPFDAGKIRSALKARRRPDSGKKETYDFELPRLKLNALLWSPTDRILVVTIARKVMENLPLTPVHAFRTPRGGGWKRPTKDRHGRTERLVPCNGQEGRLPLR